MCQGFSSHSPHPPTHPPVAKGKSNENVQFAANKQCHAGKSKQQQTARKYREAENLFHRTTLVVICCTWLIEKYMLFYFPHFPVSRSRTNGRKQFCNKCDFPVKLELSLIQALEQPLLSGILSVSMGLNMCKLWLSII